MPHRELLTESQRLSLHAPASDERGMVRHYTLSSEDLALINRRRGDPNRLGFALMLCYLHFPGRILRRSRLACFKFRFVSSPLYIVKRLRALFPAIERIVPLIPSGDAI